LSCNERSMPNYVVISLPGYHNYEILTLISKKNKLFLT